MQPMQDELRPPPPTTRRTHHTRPRKNTYTLTPEGIRVAVFYTKLRNRLLRPLLEADKPPAKVEIRQAVRSLKNAVTDYIQSARLAPAK